MILYSLYPHTLYITIIKALFTTIAKLLYHNIYSIIIIINSLQHDYHDAQCSMYRGITTLHMHIRTVAEEEMYSVDASICDRIWEIVFELYHRLWSQRCFKCYKSTFPGPELATIRKLYYINVSIGEHVASMFYHHNCISTNLDKYDTWECRPKTHMFTV